jgi:CxxC-x17-CxxC domain-containing protein
MLTDRSLTCADCGQEFIFTESEQSFYAERGFTEPRRCASCRAARKASRGDRDGSAGASSGYASSGYSRSGYGSGGYDRAPRQLFDITCASCGRPAQVPFQPSSGRPVYCADCFRR